MRAPILVRPLMDAERETLEAGLRSSDTFVLRRCQLLLASARGERVPRIAVLLGCSEQGVREAIHAFNARGLAALVKGSTAPKDRKSTRLNSSHANISYAVFCLKKKIYQPSYLSCSRDPL